MLSPPFLNKIVPLFAELEQQSVTLSEEVADFLAEVTAVLETNQDSIGSGPVSDAVRKDVMEALGTAAERYRKRIYQQGFSAAKRPVALPGCRLSLACWHVSAVSIRSNRREDGSITPNRIAVSDGGVEIKYLYEMLEGQV